MTKIIFIVFFALLLSSCVSLRAPQTHSSFTQESSTLRQAQLKKIKNWTISGAFSIQQINQQPVIANYIWHQQGNRYQIHISSVLNVYTVMITKQLHVISLYKNGNLISHASTPEKLMKNALGWSLPIGNLSDWIKGIPASEKYHAAYDAFGHIILLTQLGWQIRYAQYNTFHSIDLPAIIYLERPGINIKLIETNTVLN